MRVVGIDPGVAKTGYGVVERDGGRLVARAFGVITTAASQPHARRLAELGRALEAILDEHACDAAAVERVFFSVNVKTAMAVGQASGVVLAAAAGAGLEVTDYTPLEVKLSVVGHGSAAKAQVQAMVAAVLGLPEPPRPPDAADALALAVCHINRSGLRRAIAGARS